MQPTRTNNTTSMVRASFDQHTPKGMNSHTNQPNNKIIGTLSSSHTTHAHPNTPHNSPGPVQSGLSDPTHTHTTNKIAVNADSSERIYQRSFSYRHLTKTRLNQTVWRGVVGHADSHKATHTQPTTQIPCSKQIFKCFKQGDLNVDKHALRDLCVELVFLATQ